MFLHVVTMAKKCLIHAVYREEQHRESHPVRDLTVGLYWLIGDAAYGILDNARNRWNPYEIGRR